MPFILPLCLCHRVDFTGGVGENSKEECMSRLFVQFCARLPTEEMYLRTNSTPLKQRATHVLFLA